VWHARCQRADTTSEVLNANWVPAADGGDGRFDSMIVTGDGQRHELRSSAASVTAVAALAQADTVMMWDPTNQTLIVANVVGQMPWTVRDGGS
jgi:glycerate kinase